MSLRHPVNIEHHERRDYGERLADHVVGFMGSWRFIIIQAVICLGWTAGNAWWLAHPFDPFPPGIFLNLLLSLEAAFAAPLILLSGNRSAAKDRALAEHDYSVNTAAEERTREILDELLRNTQHTVAILEKVQG